MKHDLDDVTEALQLYTTVCTDESSLILYRELVSAINVFSSRLLEEGESIHEIAEIGMALP